MALAEQLVEQVFDGAARHLQAKVVGGHVFQRVRLVEDDDLVIGKHATAAAAQGQVAEEQGVVDDQHVGPVNLPAGLVVEALVVVRALAAQAVAAVALHQVPDGGERLEAEVAAAAFGRTPGPAADVVQLIDGGVLDEQALHALLGAAQPAQADVVGPALDEYRP